MSDNSDLEGLEWPALDAIRRDLVTEAKGNNDNLDDDKLNRLVAVLSAMRRKSAGPPKAEKATAAKTKGPRTVAQLADLV